MTKNKDKRAPFSAEFKIYDGKGKKIFHWKPSMNNLVLGMQKTNEFVSQKLGIDGESFHSDEVDEFWMDKETKKSMSDFLQKSIGNKNKR